MCFGIAKCVFFIQNVNGKCQLLKHVGHPRVGNDAVYENGFRFDNVMVSTTFLCVSIIECLIELVHEDVDVLKYGILEKKHLHIPSLRKPMQFPKQFVEHVKFCDKNSFIMSAFIT